MQSWPNEIRQMLICLTCNFFFIFECLACTNYNFIDYSSSVSSMVVFHRVGYLSVKELYFQIVVSQCMPPQSFKQICTNKSAHVDEMINIYLFFYYLYYVFNDFFFLLNLFASFVPVPKPNHPHLFFFTKSYAWGLCQLYLCNFFFFFDYYYTPQSRIDRLLSCLSGMGNQVY